MYERLGVLPYNGETGHIVVEEIWGWKEGERRPRSLALTGHEYIHL